MIEKVTTREAIASKKKIDVLKDKIEITKASEKNEYKCSVCDFKTNSRQGLKTHETRKHTKFTEESFPTQCDLCYQTFKTKEDMENHLITHSYKSSENLKYKCDECDFWCPNSQSIEAHIKKEHSENITCGICDYKATNIENLETHIVDCNIYTGCCDKICTNITEFKTHINNEHNGERKFVKHTFMDPINSEFIIVETKASDQLLKKLK